MGFWIQGKDTALMRNLITIPVILLLFSGGNRVSGGDNPHKGNDGFHKYHQTTGIPNLNYDSLFAEAASLDESPEGIELIDKCLVSYGGQEKLRNLKSFQLIYRMKPYLSSDTINVVKSFENGRRYKIVREQQDRHEERILNGEQAWFQSLDTLIAIDSGRYKAELFSYLTLSLPLALKTERFDEIKYGTRSDDSLSYIYMVKKDTLMIIAGIDPRDGYIKSSEGVIMQGEGSFVFINYFSNFKEYDGYIFPEYLNNVSMGLEVARSKLAEVKINVGFGEGEFKPNQKILKSKTY